MIIYPFSQLISEILTKIQGAKAKVYSATPSLSNTGVWQNLLTRREQRRLTDFFVIPSRHRVYAFGVTPRNQIQSRSFNYERRVYNHC